MLKRVTQALATGAAPLPRSARLAVFDPPEVPDLDHPRDLIEVISPSAAMTAACARAGLTTRTAPEGSYDAVLVFLGRSRPFTRLRLAQAVAVLKPGGFVLVDGQKTDGIETALKDCAAKVGISDSYVKSHGRLFWFQAESDFSDWSGIADDWPMVEGFHTGPGVFSADGIDPGSALLAAHLPSTLSGHGADLGAGWGYLSAGVLRDCPAVKSLNLIEDDHRALRSAERNVSDPRAHFTWADVTSYQTKVTLDFVITNPPFHAGRAADPSLGRAFLSAGADMLGRQGRLWMVANRHLPYEAHLDSLFHTVTEVTAQDGYKIIEASGPRRDVSAAAQPRGRR